MSRCLVASILLALPLMGCAACTPPPGATFTRFDGAFASRDAFKHASGGFVVGLLDGDDVPDVLALNGYTEANNWTPWRDTVLPSTLYTGVGDGTFQPWALPAGVGTGFYATAAAGDLDRDGNVDLVVPAVDQRLPGEGGETRVERGVDHWAFQTSDAWVDRTSEVAMPPSGSTLATCLGDLDRDGFLDVFMANYRDPDAFDYDAAGYRIGQPNSLYRGAEDGLMVDVTASSGAVGANSYWSDACLIFDYDGDGLQDIWVANDGGPLQVLRNTGNLVFEDASAAALGDMGTVAGNWMGLALGDYDGDGDQDVFATNFGVSGYSLVSPTTLSQPNHYILNALFQNQGDGTYVDVAPSITVDPAPVPDESWQLPEGATGLAAFEFGWAANFEDFDNDGDVDLYWNGNLAINRSAQVIGRRDHGANPGRLMQNNGPDRFQEVGEAAGVQAIDDTGFILNGWGSALVDLDRDGWLDLLLGIQWFNDEEYPGDLLVFRNNGGSRHWLEVRLVAGESNPSSLGARVELLAGGRRQVREVASQSAISTPGPLPIHFGLDSATTVESLRVVWPSGREQTLGPMEADRLVVVEEPGS